MILDRKNPDSAAEIIQKLIPEEKDKKTCLEFLANSISIAHALSPDRWGVTLKKNLIRLNVGRIETISFMPDVLRCLLDLDTIPSKLWNDEIVNLAPDENDPKIGFYKSVPKSVLCVMLFEDTEKVIPIIQDSHRILVENSSQTSRQSMIKDAHSPAVIDYLSSYLGRDIPQPAYFLRQKYT